MKLRKTLSVCLILLVLSCLGGCGTPEETLPPTTEAPITLPTRPPVETTQEPTTQPTEDSLARIEEITMVVSAEEVSLLLDYPNLKRADLTGSTCYAAIARYMAVRPEVEVVYTVPLGEFMADSTQRVLTVDDGQLDYDVLMENLQYLPALESLSLPKTDLTMEQLTAIRESYPQLTLGYSLEILGTEYTHDTTTINLSAIQPDQVEAVANDLRRLPELSFVELMSGNSSKLGKAEVKTLVDAAPWSDFHYTFNLFGKSVSTNDPTIEFKNQTIGNSGEEELRSALDILAGCTAVRLDNCKFDNEVLAQVREDYRDKGVTVAWRIWFGKNSRYSAMTDQEMIRAVYNVTDDNVHALRYCEGAKYIDMGHNDTLTDLSFVGHMPNLEILIASGCAVKELTGFENCKKLEFLELASCSYLKDISALAGCESLRFLNISFTKVSDLMALDGLPLERFVCLNPKVHPDEQEIFMSIHPDCWTRFLGKQPYGIGWRYDDNGMTYSEYYLKIREIFGYDDMPLEYD